MSRKTLRLCRPQRVSNFLLLQVLCVSCKLHPPVPFLRCQGWQPECCFLAAIWPIFLKVWWGLRSAVVMSYCCLSANWSLEFVLSPLATDMDKIFYQENCCPLRILQFSDHSVQMVDGCAWKSPKISSFWNIQSRMSGTQKNHATLKTTWITFPPHSDARFELQQVVLECVEGIKLSSLFSNIKVPVNGNKSPHTTRMYKVYNQVYFHLYHVLYTY